MVLASGVSGVDLVSGPAEARSKREGPKGDQKVVSGQKHTLFFREGTTGPCGVGVFYVFLCFRGFEWKKWDENGHGNFWMYIIRGRMI